jgi:DNA-binding transcriptional regulator YhcF (GntR family)
MKKERVYREILYGVLEKNIRSFKQIELSKECKLSLSTVNYALEPLERMNAIEKKRFGFSVIDAKKILLFWASIRKIEGEIVYQTYLNESVEKIESEIPANSVFTAYSAFKFRFKEIPSEYSEVIVYGEKEDFEKRFGKENLKFKPNLIVLKLDEHLLKFKIAPLAQIYVDLWNLPTWYAKDFLKKMEEKLHGILE